MPSIWPIFPTGQCGSERSPWEIGKCDAQRWKSLPKLGGTYIYFKDEENGITCPENASRECWGSDLNSDLSDYKASLSALPSLSANTEEGTWLERELPGSWFPKAVGVTFPRDLQASAVVEPGRWEGALQSGVSLMAGEGGGPGGRCQLSHLCQHPDYEVLSGRALLSHTHYLNGSS